MVDEGDKIAMRRAVLQTKLAEAEEQAAGWLVERNRRIVAAHKAGFSYAEIARHARLSDVAVRKIVARHLHPDGPDGRAPDVE